MTLRATGLMFLLAVLVLAPSAWAQSAISINFTGNDVPGLGFVQPVYMANTSLAGVVPKGYWNNMPANSSGTSPVLNDHSGTPTTATVTWTSGQDWGTQVGTSPGNPNRQMYSNFLTAGGGSGSSNPITLNNIPFATYDVHVYTISNAFSIGRCGSVENNGTEYFYCSAPSEAFNQMTSILSVSPTPFANYAVFPGLSGASQVIDSQYLSGGLVGVAGIQIVDASSVPVEPTTWGAIKNLYK